MQMVKIRFAERDKARGLVEVARRLKVVCLLRKTYTRWAILSASRTFCSTIKTATSLSRLIC